MDLLKKKRSVLDQRVSIVDQAIAKNNLVALDHAELKTLMKNLEDYNNQVEEVYYAILDENPADEATHTAAFLKQEKKINELMITATRLIDGIIKKAPTPHTDTHVKLPTIP